MKKFRSKVDELIDQLRAEGKVTTLSDDEVLSIDNHIRKDMERFRQNLYRKFKQSEKDLHDIILSG